MSEEELVLPDNVVPVLKADGTVLLKTLRGGRSRELVLAEAAIQQQFRAQRQRQSYCFSVQLKGEAGETFPVFMSPLQGLVTEVQVKRWIGTEQPLVLEFSASLQGLAAGFTLTVPKGDVGYVRKGNQLPQIVMPAMTPVVVVPETTETFWLNIIFKEGRKLDAGATSDSGEDLSAGTEG